MMTNDQHSFKIEVNNMTDFVLDDVLIKSLEVVFGEYGNCRGGELSLALINSDQMALLNGSYNGIHEPTDVLSFPEEEVPTDFLSICGENKRFLGEILIAPDIMIEQAPRYRNTVEQEFYRLMIHGFLHLQGFDHGTIEEKNIMVKEENILLRELLSKSV